MITSIKKLSRSTIIFYSIGFAISVYLGIRVFDSNDFNVFLYAAEKLRMGMDIYKPPYNEGGLKYYYSPLFAVLLVPFSLLPLFVSNFIWLLLNVFFLYRVIKIILEYLDFTRFSKKEFILFFVLLSLCTFRFWFHNALRNQMTMFLIWGSLESVYLIYAGRKTYGGILLAFIINIKILPITLVPYLFFRKEYKAGFVTIVAFCLFLFLPSIFLGVNHNLELMNGWWELINPMRDRFITGEIENGPHSLSALIPSLFMETVNTVPFKRNIMNLDEVHVKLLLNLSRLFFVGLTLYFLRWMPFRKNDNTISRYWELSYILIITPLIFPQQLCYSFLYIFPAIAYIVWYILFTRKGNQFPSLSKKLIFIQTLLLVSFVMLTLTSEDFIGRKNTEITYHFRIITYGTFLLITILAICIPPQRISSKNE